MPEKDNVELASRQTDFARTFVKQKKVTDKELKYIRETLKELSARVDALS
jgi:5-bromo-4-chloroindolyl phosphate hydrolysis protein